MASLPVRIGLAGALGAMTAAMLFFGEQTTPSDRALAAPSLRVSAVSPVTDGPAAAFRPGDEFRFSPAAGAHADVLAATPLREAFERLLASDFAGANRIAKPFADAGNADAQHLLGYLHERGLGVDANIGKALELYSAAAAAGNVDAMLSLGDLAMRGDGVERDFGTAIGWYSLGAEAGDARAEARLGAIHADGLGAPRDMGRALDYFDRAAAKGDPDAHFALGLARLSGDGRPLDYAAAAAHFETAANAGHAGAAYHLGLLYDSPYLGAPNPVKAANWFTRAADAGYGPAMTALGLFAHRGDAEGAPADWFEKAARAGDPQGRFLFAVAVAKGDGRDADHSLARTLAEDVLQDPAAGDPLKANARALIASLDIGPAELRLRN